MKTIFRVIILLTLNQIALAQNEEEVWGIGTKWTYEFNRAWESNDTLDFAIIEIIDTVTIDNLKLYLLNRSHSTCDNKTYLHYSDNKVYNYDINNKFLQLVFDFETEEDYTTEYRPHYCFGVGPDSSLVQMRIKVDSILPYQMPDGSFRRMQYINAINDFSLDTTIFSYPNRILEGIGFMNGSGYETHEWFVEGEFCDQWTCFPKHIRCFENDSVKYNFVGFPCDSVFTSSIIETNTVHIKVHPNPTYENISITSNLTISKFRLFTFDGRLIQEGPLSNWDTIKLFTEGVYILMINVDEKWIIRKVIKL